MLMDCLGPGLAIVYVSSLLRSRHLGRQATLTPLTAAGPEPHSFLCTKPITGVVPFSGTVPRQFPTVAVRPITSRVITLS